MAVDNNLKHKRKREEARKKTALERERISQFEKIDANRDKTSYESWMGNWSTVLRYALKALKLAPSDKFYWNHACRAASELKDDVTLLKLLNQGWRQNKEYILRGLVKSALILAPGSLINQWKEELKSKFDLDVVASTDALFRENSEQFWQAPFLLVSLQTARSKRRMDEVCARSYDMLIVDEAHHLKNQTTMNWKLVNAIQKTFLLLLTATPVQNNLEELYNLVTLLKPGHLKYAVDGLKEQFAVIQSIIGWNLSLLKQLETTAVIA